MVPIFAKFGYILDQFGPNIVFRTYCIYFHHIEENEVLHDILSNKSIKVEILVPILTTNGSILSQFGQILSYIKCSLFYAEYEIIRGRMTSFVIKVSKIYLWYQFLDKIGSIFSQIAPDPILTRTLIYAHKVN